MSITEVVEESLKADPRFRHLTVMPTLDQVVNNFATALSMIFGIPKKVLLGYVRDENDQG